MYKLHKLVILLLFFVNVGSLIADDSLLISRLSAYDAGDYTTKTLSIDVTQDVCESDSEDTVYESFNDTVLGIDVENDLNTVVRCTNFSYLVRNAFGTGVKLRSSSLALSGSNRIDPKSETRVELQALFFHAKDGRKYYTGNSTAIPDDLGFRNVTVRLKCRTSTGERRTLVGRTALSFGNFNRCE